MNDAQQKLNVSGDNVTPRLGYLDDAPRTLNVPGDNVKAHRGYLDAAHGNLSALPDLRVMDEKRVFRARAGAKRDGKKPRGVNDWT